MSGSEPVSQFATQERGADVATPLGLMWRPPLELEKLSLLDWQIAGAWVRAKSWSFEIFARASDWVPAMIATAGYCCTYERCSRQSPYFPPLLVGAPCPPSCRVANSSEHRRSTKPQPGTSFMMHILLGNGGRRTNNLGSNIFLEMVIFLKF